MIFQLYRDFGFVIFQMLQLKSLRLKSLEHFQDHFVWGQSPAGMRRRLS